MDKKYNNKNTVTYQKRKIFNKDKTKTKLIRINKEKQTYQKIKHMF